MARDAPWNKENPCCGSWLINRDRRLSWTVSINLCHVYAYTYLRIITNRQWRWGCQCRWHIREFIISAFSTPRSPWALTCHFGAVLNALTNRKSAYYYKTVLSNMRIFSKEFSKNLVDTGTRHSYLYTITEKNSWYRIIIILQCYNILCCQFCNYNITLV